MILKEIRKLTVQIKLLTGLHIGGNKDIVEIGGIDSPVVKNPNTQIPYIPGSSIKGKMRFWMEWKTPGKIIAGDKGEPHNCHKPDCPVCRIFGSAAKNKNYGPTRISVSDAIMHEDDRDAFLEGDMELEDKVENRINRLTGAATDPRHMERVPEGFRFKFDIAYKIFEIDKEKDLAKNGKNLDEQFWDNLLNILYFLQEEGLGGSVSRGYGRFEIERVDAVKLSGSYGDTDQREPEQATTEAHGQKTASLEGGTGTKPEPADWEGTGKNLELDEDGNAKLVGSKDEEQTSHG